MRISKFLVEVIPWHYHGPGIEMKWRIVDGDGKEYLKNYIFRSEDDLKSLFDVIWEESKKEMEKFMEIKK